MAIKISDPNFQLKDPFDLGGNAFTAPTAAALDTPAPEERKSPLSKPEPKEQGIPARINGRRKLFNPMNVGVPEQPAVEQPQVQEATLRPDQAYLQKKAAAITPQNAEIQQYWQQLEGEEPGRYRIIDAKDYQQWHRAWKEQQPGWIEDQVRLFGGSTIRDTGAVLRGIGAMNKFVDDHTLTPLLNTIFQTDAFTKRNTMEPSAEALETFGAKMKEGISQKTKELLADSSPAGDFLDPSTWTLGEAPSVEGYVSLMFETMGSMVPVIAAGIASGPAGGALIGGAQGGGHADKQTRELFDQMEKMPGELERNSALYREYIARGMSHKQAFERAKDAAAQAAMLMTTPISAAGGFATSKLLSPATKIMNGKNIAAQIAGRTGLSALEEGTQEAAESMATQLGMNVGAGMDTNITDGTFADFVLGALAGGSTGAGAGVVESVNDLRANKVIDPKGAIGRSVQHGDEQTPDAPINNAPIVDAEAAPEELEIERVERAQASAELIEQLSNSPRFASGAQVTIEHPVLGSFNASVDSVEPEGALVIDEATGELHLIDFDLVQPRQGELRAAFPEPIDPNQLVEENDGSPVDAFPPISEPDDVPFGPTVRDQIAAAQPKLQSEVDETNELQRKFGERSVTFPDQQHAQLYDLGDKLRKARYNSKLEQSKIKELLADDIGDVARALDITLDDAMSLSEDYTIRTEQGLKSKDGDFTMPLAGKTRLAEMQRAKVRSEKKAADEAAAQQKLAEPKTPTDEAAQEAATSPLNDLPEPSQAQKEAGNYKVGRMKLGGMDISIENPKGSQRKGTDADGKEWAVTMKSHYGYFRGTEGRDLDHIDTFVKDGTEELSDNAPVFVVDQVNEDGSFDEHKVMLGYKTLGQARNAYMANYAKGWKGLGDITKTTMADFRTWANDGDTKKAFKKAVTPDKKSAGTKNTNPKQEEKRTDKPMAVEGLTSYRYQGRYGPIMIGAKDIDDALNEANRSLSGSTAAVENLEVWDGDKYVSVTDKTVPAQKAKVKNKTKVSPDKTDKKKDQPDKPQSQVVKKRKQTVYPSITNAAFERWSGGAEVIEASDINDASFKGKGPFVMKAYHGTTNEFEVFDASIKGTKEGQFGAVNYFTSSEEDASHNYGASGQDLTNLIERAAEILADEITDLYEQYDSDEEGVKAVKEEYGENFYNEDFMDMARAIERDRLAGTTEKVMEVYLKTEKPFVVGDNQWMEIVDFEDLELRAIDRVSEDQDISVEEVKENRDDYEDAIAEARWEIEAEEGNPLYEAVERVALDAGIEPSELFNGLESFVSEELNMDQFEQAARQAEGLQYAEDPESGDLIGYHLLGQIIRELGYDSIILKNADSRFHEMDMYSGTAHIHIFDEHNANIKSVANRGEFDPNNPNIYAKPTTGKGRKFKHKNMEALKKIVSDVGGIKDVEVAESLVLENPEGWDMEGPAQVAGLYYPMQDVVVLAADQANERTAYHEAFHRLQNLYLTKGEKRALKGDLPRLRRIVRTDPTLAAQVKGMSQQELEAEAFAIYAKDGTTIRPLKSIAAAWDHIAEVIDKIKAYLKGENINATLDLFDEAKRGDVAKRKAGKPSLKVDKAPKVDTKAFKNWFGDSKVVDSKGKPLVVYHGTPDARGIFDGKFQKKLGGADAFFFTDSYAVAATYADDRRALDYQNARPAVGRLYLKIENPMIIDAKGKSWGERGGPSSQTKQLDEAKAKGHDGIIIRNTLDTYNVDGDTRADVFIAFNPTQIKSAQDGPVIDLFDQSFIDGTGPNSGQFDPNDPNVMARPVSDRLPKNITSDGLIKELIDQLKGKWTDLSPNILQLIPLNYFEELAQPNMTAVKDYMRHKMAMDTFRGDQHAAADKIAQEWLKYTTSAGGYHRTNSDKTRAQHLSDLMHESTLAGVDPSSTAKKHTEHSKYADLRARYQEMPPAGRELFKKVRDAYKDQSELLDSIILENIKKTQEFAQRRAQKEFEVGREKLQRKIEVVKKKGDKDRVKELEKELNDLLDRFKKDYVRAKSTGAARLIKLRKTFEQTKANDPYFPLARTGDYFVTVRDDEGDVISFSRREKAVDRDKLAAQMRKEFPDATVETGVLEGGNSDVRDAMDPRIVGDIQKILGDAGVDEQVQDMIWQRYLESMPDLSTRKRFIHRKGTAGFDADALKAFSKHMFHASHQMARLKFGMDLQEAANEVSDQAKVSADPTKGVRLANQLKKNHQWVMNPTGSSFAQRMNSIAFVWFLGITPAAALVNLTQTPMMGIPIIGARFGFDKAAKAMAKSSQDSVLGKGSVANSPKLTDAEKSAMEAFSRSGLVDKTQAHDLAGVGDTGVNYSPLMAKSMAIIGKFFHSAEVWNREVTALTAYRVAVEAGQSHRDAIETAHDLTWKTHFDYSNSSRPSILQNDFAKVALVFRAHSINMIYRVVRDIHQSLKGETPEARRVARRQLVGIFGMLQLMAGTAGLFGFNQAMWIMNMIFGDDDDPLDFETRMKKDLYDVLGPQLGGIILNGVPGHYMKADLTSRIGLADIWFRSSNRDLEGGDQFQDWLLQSTGAGASMVGNWFRGAEYIRKGQFADGIEMAGPKALRDLMRGYRRVSDGVVSAYSGNQIIAPEDLSLYDNLTQAFGFTPASVAETWDRNAALRRAKSKVMRQRSRLLHKFALAHSMGDKEMRKQVVEDIAKFNKGKANRGLRITGETLQKSLAARRRNAKQRQDGVIIQNDHLNRALRSGLPERIHK